MKSGQALNAMTDTSFGQKSGGRHAEVEAGIRATRPQVRDHSDWQPLPARRQAGNDLILPQIFRKEPALLAG